MEVKLDLELVRYGRGFRFGRFLLGFCFVGVGAVGVEGLDILFLSSKFGVVVWGRV